MWDFSHAMDETDSLSETLKNNILRRMKVFGDTRRSLERRAGLKERAVASILDGTSRHPRIDTVAKIARALGSSVGELIGEPPRLDSIEEAQLRERIFDAVSVHLAMMIDEDVLQGDRRLIEDLADAMSDAILSHAFYSPALTANADAASNVVQLYRHRQARAARG
jgi:transcriptional regulator with XRE-family HTH domain